MNSQLFRAREANLIRAKKHNQNSAFEIARAQEGDRQRDSGLSKGTHRGNSRIYARVFEFS